MRPSAITSLFICEAADANGSRMDPALTVPDDRSCGTCTLCCRLPDIDFFDKPANQFCVHCLESQGCSIYSDRPSLCRDFLCLWRTDGNLSPVWDPTISGMMAYRQGAQITVLVDPDHPQVWRNEPHRTELSRWAKDAAESGGYVIVFCGDDVFKI